jgi:hypothetical protein
LVRVNKAAIRAGVRSLASIVGKEKLEWEVIGLEGL